MRRVAVLLALAALGLTACGKSPEDQARKDGEQLGAAVKAVTTASSPSDLKSALQGVKSEVGDLGGDAKDAVQAQVQVQSDTLQSAFGGGKQQLQAAAQELRSQAESFRHSGDSVANEFWRGFEDGYDGDT